MGICDSKSTETPRKNNVHPRHLRRNSTSASTKHSLRKLSFPAPPTTNTNPPLSKRDPILLTETEQQQLPHKHTFKRRNTTNLNNTNNNNNLIISSGLVVDCNVNNPKSQYTIISKLGEGAFGNVWKVKKKQTGIIRAMKRIPKQRKRTLSNVHDIINEIETLKQLDHPHIVKIFEFFIEADGYYLITEYCRGGELFDVIKRKRALPEHIAANIMYQLFTAVNYCHTTKQVIHRDLKPENILVESIDEATGYYNIKVIDFGTAKIYEHDQHEHKIVGSTYYIAPEVLNKNYNAKCDIWSCGVILYMLLSGKVPFNGENSAKILQKIKIGKYDLTRSPFDTISTHAKDLISQCLDVNVKRRITAKNALTHEWFRICDTKKYFCEVNKYFYNKIINNLITYTPKNKLQEVALTYLVHNFPNLDEVKCINKVFANVNTHANGKVTKTEMTTAFKAYLHVNSDDEFDTKIEEIFSNIDTDKNGYIENEEFIRAALDKNVFLDEKVLRFIFEFLDKDGSGQITLDELKRVFGVNANKEAEGMLIKIIKDIDMDNNGEISFEEFKRMMINIINV